MNNASINNSELNVSIKDAAAAISRLAFKACVITFGCQQNEADSEKIRGMLKELGYEITEKENNSDLIILNTCAIRERAEMKVYSMLGRLKELKKTNSNLLIGVVGCMSAQEHAVKRLRSDFPYVDFTLEPSALAELPFVVAKRILNSEKSYLLGTDDGTFKEGLPTARGSKYKAWVSVMYGCNNFCTYCIVPYVRGRERSRRAEDIINECRSLVEGGVREITLLGQNVNSYKSDTDFAGLIRRIAEIEGDFIIRFMTSHPKDVSENLIDAIAESKGKIAPHFHLPLQSGSDRILKAMNRTYNTERYLSVVDKLRLKVPDIAITSDIIVGFPGESEEDFLATLDMIRRVKFDAVYAFIYSKRKGTPASRMENQIDEKIKKERISRLLKLTEEIALSENAANVGKTLRVLVDGFSVKKGEGVLKGRCGTSKLVHFLGDRSLVGSFVKVKITRASAFDLYGEIEN